MRDIVRTGDLLAAFVLIFLYHVSSSVRSIIVQEIMMMYKPSSVILPFKALTGHDGQHRRIKIYIVHSRHCLK